MVQSYDLSCLPPSKTYSFTTVALLFVYSLLPPPPQARLYASSIASFPSFPSPFLCQPPPKHSFRKIVWSRSMSHPLIPAHLPDPCPQQLPHVYQNPSRFWPSTLCPQLPSPNQLHNCTYREGRKKPLAVGEGIVPRPSTACPSDPSPSLMPAGYPTRPPISPLHHPGPRLRQPPPQHHNKLPFSWCLSAVTVPRWFTGSGPSRSPGA